MAKRVCRHCPRLIPTTNYKGMCDDCRRTWDKARGTRTDRGYGPDHQAERNRIANLIRAGITIRCVTCNTKLDPTFHLGHNDQRTEWIGPQCPHCNDSQAGTRSHQTSPH